jgi:hypothetical protein
MDQVFPVVRSTPRDCSALSVEVHVERGPAKERIPTALVIMVVRTESVSIECINLRLCTISPGRCA